ncbi:MAG: hypothetical protein QOH01_2957 [Verrucomicrobiota bacterium]|jgi:hypothetical protein
MKTAAQIASHPKARLHRELVANLRAFGSIEGAERAWLRFPLDPRLWRRIVTYGLGLPERQMKLNKIAFPDSNATEVDAALQAGNNLNRLYDLARGCASVAIDSAGHPKLGSKGLKIIRQAKR